MADVTLNFDEESLEEGSALYNLYRRLYNGTVSANSIEAPDYSQNPPTTADGQIDIDAITQGLKEYSDTLIKNSAYLYASSILSSIEGSVGGVDIDTSSFLSRTGDSMDGLLNAQYGFRAGVGGEVLFSIEEYGDASVLVSYCDFNVYGDINSTGVIEAGGLAIGGVSVLSVVGGKLVFSYDNINIEGDVSINGEFSVGDFYVSGEGAFWEDNEFYHTGNANSDDVDWSMFNAFVYGDFEACGTALFCGAITSLFGANLGYGGSQMMSFGEDGVAIDADILIAEEKGLKINGTYVLRERSESIISILAPGKVINLGDGYGEGGDYLQTLQINLQTDLCNNAGNIVLVSAIGDGNFPNSFQAGCGNAGNTVLQTYYSNMADYGVLVGGLMRFGGATGPYITSVDNTLAFSSPYAFDGVSKNILTTFSYKTSTSLFRDLALGHGESAHISTDAEMFVFDKHVESTSFAIVSERYKTILMENALMFGDGVFLEGVDGGVLHNGNASFTGIVGSRRFASGFAGYGWQIGNDDLYGGVAATFDHLTVRGAMRAYAFEVVKTYASNGSMWVSDTCSGDIVEEII